MGNSILGCRALTEREISQILDRLTPRDAMLFQLGLKTGFRIQELLSIEISDLYEYTGVLKTTITVARKNMKGKLSSRSVPLSDDCIHLLKSYISSLDRQKYLFQSQKGSKLSRIQAWRAIHNAARECGLTGKIATHSARKTVAIKAYKASGNDMVATQKILGHKNINSTISYLSLDDESLKSVWDKVQK